MMKKLVIEYKGFIFNVDCSDVNTQIKGSWRVEGKKDMKEFLEILRERLADKELAINKRTMKSMVREWTAHNRLYSLGLFRSHTADVDLNMDEPWYRRLAYILIGV